MHAYWYIAYNRLLEKIYADRDRIDKGRDGGENETTLSIHREYRDRDVTNQVAHPRGARYAL